MPHWAAHHIAVSRWMAADGRSKASGFFDTARLVVLPATRSIPSIHHWSDRRVSPSQQVFAAKYIYMLGERGVVLLQTSVRRTAQTYIPILVCTVVASKGFAIPAVTCGCGCGLRSGACLLASLIFLPPLRIQQQKSARVPAPMHRITSCAAPSSTECTAAG